MDSIEPVPSPRWERSDDSMRSIDSRALRMSWRTVLADACTGGEAYVILRRGRPEAVLVSQASWLRGCAKIPVPVANQRLIAASDARSSLSAVRTAAHTSGRHTLIRKRYGSLFRADSPAEFDAVIAPYDWLVAVRQHRNGAHPR
ncbi:type II toxin-antitoxin system Phd/YefM family antitoxin [Nocardia huaxiensis]|uniref:type II toxin-antitoxin system Phd/YefM family antitoxin n=1 Tax=Nocardia huaxiensis TaxID=2755382 RepID=UPI001E502E84|nr:type II toxin-antitoxin system Phd/YefM family antitoxin [Nocardia huaxiensis]UFS93664.1 type II toxin-antitoxin system Phd/YefM family antitoxin [Nocardia huaxiensis]